MNFPHVNCLHFIASHSLVRIIQRWERSGQGEGGHAAANGDDIEDYFEIRQPTGNTIDPSSPRFGTLEGRNCRTLSTQRNFLQGKPRCIRLGVLLLKNGDRRLEGGAIYNSLQSHFAIIKFNFR